MNKFIKNQIWTSILKGRELLRKFYKAHHKDSESFLVVEAVLKAPASLNLRETEI